MTNLSAEHVTELIILFIPLVTVMLIRNTQQIN